MVCVIVNRAAAIFVCDTDGIDLRFLPCATEWVCQHIDLYVNYQELQAQYDRTPIGFFICMLVDGHKEFDSG